MHGDGTDRQGGRLSGCSNGRLNGRPCRRRGARSRRNRHKRDSAPKPEAESLAHRDGGLAGMPRTSANGYSLARAHFEFWCVARAPGPRRGRVGAASETCWKGPGRVPAPGLDHTASHPGPFPHRSAQPAFARACHVARTWPGRSYARAARSCVPCTTHHERPPTARNRPRTSACGQYHQHRPRLPNTTQKSSQYHPEIAPKSPQKTSLTAAPAPPSTAPKTNEKSDCTPPQHVRARIESLTDCLPTRHPLARRHGVRHHCVCNGHPADRTRSPSQRILATTRDLPPTPCTTRSQVHRRLAHVAPTRLAPHTYRST